MAQFRHVPYEVSFTRRVPIVDRAAYINECCVGGDIVAEQLLPAVLARYGDADTNQEDWGWFIWFRDGDVRLAIDIFADDPDDGAFRIHLTSRVKRLLGERIVDTPELLRLKAIVVDVLKAWTDGPIDVTTLDRNCM
jgi:hypothetical protein